MPITNIGYLALAPADIFAEVKTLFQNVFGVNVDTNPQSPVGQMIQEFTNALISVEGDKTLLYSGLYNPDVASGIFLDGIAKFDEINRIPAAKSIVDVVVTGTAGLVIPAGSSITNENGDLFTNQLPITIGVNGTGTGEFQAVEFGLIDVNVNTVNRIVQRLPGWDTVTNPQTGAIGRLKETDDSFRKTRRYALAVNSSGTLLSLNAALEQDIDVKNYLVLENTTDAPIVVNSANIPAHGIFVSLYCIDYSSAIAIIFNKKSGGCAMGGNTTVTYTSPKYPWVQANITYQTAIVTNIFVTVNYIGQADLPPNIQDLIKENIVNNFYGIGVNIDKVRIGDTIYAGRFYQSVTSLGINQITSIGVGNAPNTTSPSFSLTALSVGVINTDNVIISVL